MYPGIGVDLLHLPRLASLVSRRSTYLDRFARRILTPNEFTTFRTLAQASSTANTNATSSLIRWLGVRWAAKEAAFKAGGPRYWKQVEVKYLDSGKPYLAVGGREGGLSISHDGEYVVAMAMIPPALPDPMSPQMMRQNVALSGGGLAEAREC
ncbi:4'-phosphopantetheinyl transferase [Ascodesmis nigricans]|uniref:4'-phosphopantetheinyl transferase n=1 Tax=Ascodesmis nigricans TaxID=341454 RepID=A0A4S2N1L3_9PEZI|nr:4'-phosphopantetheinyl transferase [Ascodesmis nigricans]